MFFLLRVAFWLTIVLVLLPSGKSPSGSQIDATDAVAAAGAAVSDVSGFCERQRGACEVGAQAAAAIGQRAQAGAMMVYEFLSERVAHERTGRGATGSVTSANLSAAQAVPQLRGSLSTLRPSDLEPTWQAPPGRGENVPLPRKDPRGRA